MPGQRAYVVHLRVFFFKYVFLFLLFCVTKYSCILRPHLPFLSPQGEGRRKATPNASEGKKKVNIFIGKTVKMG